MSGRATARCTVWADGRNTEVALLYGISAEVIDAALYSDEPIPLEDRGPPIPTEDGVYLLIDNKWVEQ